jgi:hypothetical protein
MQRRHFIHLSAYAAAALTLPFAAGCNHQQIDIEAQPLFFSHLADVKTIMETGAAYRKTHPAEDNKNKLAELLLANNPLTASADNKAIQLMLDNKVKNDFKTGKIDVVNGWVLSVTEARQCALFSIMHS